MKSPKTIVIPEGLQQRESKAVDGPALQSNFTAKSILHSALWIFLSALEDLGGKAAIYVYTGPADPASSACRAHCSDACSQKPIVVCFPRWYRFPSHNPCHILGQLIVKDLRPCSQRDRVISVRRLLLLPRQVCSCSAEAAAGRAVRKGAMEISRKKAARTFQARPRRPAKA